MASIAPTADGRFVVCTHCAGATSKTLARSRPLATSQSAPLDDAAVSRSVPTTVPSAGTGRMARRLERAIVVFTGDDAVLPQVARERLLALLPVLGRAVRVRAVGYTDDRVARARGDALAQARSQAVVDFLGRHLDRANAPHWVVVGQGACCYLTTNRTESGRIINRRVELLIELEDSAETDKLVDKHHSLLTPLIRSQGGDDALG